MKFWFITGSQFLYGEEEILIGRFSLLLFLPQLVTSVWTSVAGMELVLQRIGLTQLLKARTHLLLISSTIRQSVPMP